MERFKVKLLADWYSDQESYNMLNKQTPNKGGVFKNIELTTDQDTADYFVIFNNTTSNRRLTPDNTLYFSCEPPGVFRRDWENNKLKYKHNYSIENYQMPIYWDLMSKDYDWFKNTPIEKTKYISSILSAKQFLPGQRLRLNFAAKYLDKIDRFELYGGNALCTFRSYKGKVPTFEKEQALLDYKYTFNAENSSVKNYYTEKLTDAILCECLCFYWGCPNVEDFIDPNCYIKLDLTKPEESLDVVISAIRNNEWEKRIDSIRKEKQRILDDKQILSFISERITELEKK